MRRLFPWAVAGFLLLWLLNARCGIYADEPKIANVDLIGALRARQQGAKQVQYTWRTKETRVLPVNAGAFEGDGGGTRKTFSNTYDRGLELDGNFIRLEDAEPAWDLDNRQYFERSQTDVVNAAAGKSFSVLKRPAGLTRQAILKTPEKALHYIASNFPLTPLLDHFRPGWRLEGQLAGVKAEPNQGVIAGRSYSIYKVKREFGTSVRTTSYWIDPLRDHAIVRVVHEVNGKSLLQEDRVYKELSKFGWVPVSWKYVESFQDGSLSRSIEAESMSVKVNEPIAPGRFEIDLPPDTTIFDLTRQNDGP